MKGEGTAGSLTALGAPRQARDPGGMAVGSNDGEQTQGRGRAREETQVSGQVLGAAGPAGLALLAVATDRPRLCRTRDGSWDCRGHLPALEDIGLEG